MATPENAFSGSTSLDVLRLQREVADMEAREYMVVSEICREKARHENELTNHRLSWNFTIQGFLFAAYALCVQTMGSLKIKLAEIKIADVKTASAAAGEHISSEAEAILTGNIGHLSTVLIWLCLAGIIVSVFIFVGAGAAQLAIRSVAQIHKEHDEENKDKDWWRQVSPIRHHSGLLGGGNKWAYGLGALLPLAIPLVFVVIWLALLSVKF